MRPDGERVNILVVDDLPEKLLAYEAVLEELGENLVLVSSGTEALKQVLANQFAVILLDVNMPDIDGFETARLIRGHRRSSATPIIFLTAFADEVRTAEGYATGAVDYLPTPIVPEILRAKVRVFVELFRMRREVAQRAEEQARHAAAEEANRRLTFLSDAGAVLGRSLDFTATAGDLVRLSVPLLSDICTVTFAPGIAAPCHHIMACKTSGPEPVVSRPEDLDVLPEGLCAAIRHSLKTGRRVLWPAAPSADSTIPTSAVAIPLEARDRTFAVLTLFRSEGSGPLTTQDITLATALASRGATALDNALLHEELRRADRQKIDFLSMLAHELRNPLSPIVNAVRLMRMRTPNQPDLQWAGQVIDRQVAQMVRLVDDLLDVSRITCGKIRLQMTPVDLRTVVAHAVEASQPLIDEHGHTLTVAVPDEGVWVNGDQARLTQVLTNLLNNAAKYTEDGGQIRVTLKQQDGDAVLSVRDTGVGIPRDMLASVFELFTQVERGLDRSSGGLGIGLTLVQSLVTMHGGHVSADSEGIGRGSEFSVSLPILVDHMGREDDAPADGDGTQPPSGAEVLIVDDNTDAADTLATFLRLSGHAVRVAYDGPSGLAAAQLHKPSVILLDIGLPGLDGYTVASRLRQLEATRNCLMIAISGYGRGNDDQASREAGFDDHLVKPVNLNDLLARLAAGRQSEAERPALCVGSAMTEPARALNAIDGAKGWSVG